MEWPRMRWRESVSPPKKAQGHILTKVHQPAHDWIIDELNTHATAVAHTRKRTTDAYSDAFDKFIAALKEEGITTASDLNPSVRTAYDALKTAQVYEPKARNKSGKNGNPAKG